MRVLDTKLGGLDCRVLDGSDEGTGPRGVVIFCHGFGAPSTDLVGFAPEIVRHRPELRSLRFIFPAAPLAPPELYGGRAWWPLDVLALQEALARGEARNLEDTVPEGLAAARHKLLALVEESVRMTGLPVSQHVLGGFSQGAMIACDVALRLEEAPAALVQLSPTLLAQSEWRPRAARRAGLDVFMSHGRQDPILPFAQAEKLKALFDEAGLRVRFLPFDGPHTVPAEAVSEIADLLAAKLMGEEG
jgi:phospholipase/carboxylesterase